MPKPKRKTKKSFTVHCGDCGKKFKATYLCPKCKWKTAESDDASSSLQRISSSNKNGPPVSKRPVPTPFTYFVC